LLKADAATTEEASWSGHECGCWGREMQRASTPLVEMPAGDDVNTILLLFTA
jgi:hypothetical protein